MKRVWPIILATVLVVVLGVAYFTRTGYAPAGQPALVEINSSAFAALRTEFNEGSEGPRVILLLSPT